MKARALPLAAALALGACSVAPTAPTVPVSTSTAAPRPSSSTEELLAYLEKLKAMNERALAAETAKQKQAVAREPTDAGRIRLALALAVSAQTEDAEIAAAVEPLLRRDGRQDAEVRAMASFLQLLAAERRRSRESAAAAGVRLRDERKAVESQKARADALQEKAAELQQKLDALTDLEKSLSDRPLTAR